MLSRKSQDAVASVGESSLIKGQQQMIQRVAFPPGKRQATHPLLGLSLKELESLLPPGQRLRNDATT